MSNRVKKAYSADEALQLFKSGEKVVLCVVGGQVAEIDYTFPSDEVYELFENLTWLDDVDNANIAQEF